MAAADVEGEDGRLCAPERRDGALVGGIGRALQRRSPGTLVIGVVAKEAPVMARSWDAGRAVECSRMATFADGLAVRVAIPEAVALLDRVVDRMVPVSERSIALAMGACAKVGIRVEPAAAAGLAALPAISDVEGPIVAIVTGRNVDDEIWRQAVENPGAFPD